jgi:hypothetical protein
MITDLGISIVSVVSAWCFYYIFDMEQPTFYSWSIKEYSELNPLLMILMEEQRKYSTFVLKTSLVLVYIIEPEPITMIWNLNMAEYPVNVDLLC